MKYCIEVKSIINDTWVQVTKPDTYESTYRIYLNLPKFTTARVLEIKLTTRKFFILTFTVKSTRVIHIKETNYEN